MYSLMKKTLNGKNWKNVIRGKDIIQLKRNYIPKGIITLEKLFDQNDVAKDPKVQLARNDIEDQNIGTEDSPIIVKLSRNFPVIEKEKYIHLVKNYTDVFAWRYEYLKVYDTSIIQHTIPIIPGEKPFRQKLRRINRMLLPLIEK